MSDKEMILENAELMYVKSYQGYKRFQSSEGPDKHRALLDVPTYGRACTRTLHQLKRVVENFDEWWTPRQQVLEGDEICQYMWDLRNKILKEGEISTSSYAKIDKLSTEDVYIPPWADSAFIGDGYGGEGYKIEGPDGEETKVYTDLELEGIESGMYFTELEGLDHEELPSPRVEDAIQHYLLVLYEVLDDAKSEFAPASEE